MNKIDKENQFSWWTQHYVNGFSQLPFIFSLSHYLAVCRTVSLANYLFPHSKGFPNLKFSGKFFNFLAKKKRWRYSEPFTHAWYLWSHPIINRNCKMGHKKYIKLRISSESERRPEIFYRHIFTMSVCMSFCVYMCCLRASLCVCVCIRFAWTCQLM